MLGRRAWGARGRLIIDPNPNLCPSLNPELESNLVGGGRLQGAGWRHRLRSMDAILIASDLSVSVSITSVWSPAHELMPCTCDCAYLSSPASAQLDLSDNSIGGYLDDDYNFISTPEGPKAIADALLVCASMTRLNVEWNSLGKEGEAALREAIEGRSGFELQLIAGL